MPRSQTESRTTRRTRPLAVGDQRSSDERSSDERSSDEAVSAALLTGVDADDVVLDDLDALDAAADADERHERFLDGVRGLRVGGASSLLSERLLLVLGGIIAPLGLVVVVLGWWGASNTPYDFEQVPYLISGGLLGLGLVFLGGFFYFAHWITQLVKEQREQSAAILSALHRLVELEEED